MKYGMQPKHRKLQEVVKPMKKAPMGKAVTKSVPKVKKGKK